MSLFFYFFSLLEKGIAIWTILAILIGALILAYDYMRERRQWPAIKGGPRAVQ